MGFTPFPSHGSHPEADPEMCTGQGPLSRTRQTTPSCRIMTRSQKEAAKESWVTMKMVASRDCFACSKEEITARLDLESKFPVGSSAKMSRGLLMRHGPRRCAAFHRRRSLPGISPEWRRCRTPGTAGQRAAPCGTSGSANDGREKNVCWTVKPSNSKKS